jgi:hypothetical protein
MRRKLVNGSYLPKCETQRRLCLTGETQVENFWGTKEINVLWGVHKISCQGILDNCRVKQRSQQ